MTSADTPEAPRRRRVGLFGHILLWFAGSWALPSLVFFVLLAGSGDSNSTGAPDFHAREITPISGAIVVAWIWFPYALLHLVASLLCGVLIHGFSTRWRGAWWTLAGASASSLALLLPDPGGLGKQFHLARMAVVVPLALSPLLGLALLRRSDSPASVLLRIAGTIVALAIGGYFGWESHRAWWFEPRWKTMEATVGEVQHVLDEIVDRPEFRRMWHEGGWGARSQGWAVPRDGRHSSFSNQFDSGEVTAELRWDFAADRPEIVVGGVESAPATAMAERLSEVAPSRGWTIRRVVGSRR